MEEFNVKISENNSFTERQLEILNTILITGKLTGCELTAIQDAGIYFMIDHYDIVTNTITIDHPYSY